MASILKVDKLDPQSGTALEIGTSGDTVSIPSGVTIANSGTATGFGATLSGSTNNTVATVTGANALIGEANLTFDGTDLTVGIGNLVIGTGGKGIDFSAQTATSASGATTTSELLDHYEEGTWTPSLGGTTTYHSQTGEYTRIGRYIFVQAVFQVNVIGTGSTTTVTGLPFSISGLSGGVNRYVNGATSVMWIMPSPAPTTTAFCGMTAAASSVTDNLVLFASGTQIQFFIVGKAA